MTAEEYSRCIVKLNPAARVVVWDIDGVLTPKWDEAHTGPQPTLAECEAVLAEVRAEIALATRITYITNRQGKRQLVAMGLYEPVKALIDAAGLTAQIDWDSASGFSRTDPTFLAVKAALNLTDEQEETFFVEGARL